MTVPAARCRGVGCEVEVSVPGFPLLRTGDGRGVGVARRGGDVRDVELFEAALGLVWPWKVESVVFSEEAGRLDVALNYERGGTFRCPQNVVGTAARRTTRRGRSGGT